jgi:hypothetical protein
VPGAAASITIARSPEEVFAYLADFGNDVRWREGVVAMRPVGRSEDVGGVWSRQVEVRRVPGRTLESEAIVTASEPGKRLAVRRASGPIRPEATYQLTPEGGGTRLDFRLDVALAGAAWLALPAAWLFLRFAIAPVLPRDLERLKREIEAA